MIKKPSLLFGSLCVLKTSPNMLIHVWSWYDHCYHRFASGLSHIIHLKSTDYYHISITDIIAVVINARAIRELHTKNGTSSICEITWLIKSINFLFPFFIIIYCLFIVHKITWLLFRLTPITVTLWDQFAHNEGKLMADIISRKPIVIGTRLKVVSFHGTHYAYTTLLIYESYENYTTFMLFFQRFVPLYKAL